jgi:hypothetical protein
MPLSTFLDGTAPSQLRGLNWLSLSDLGTVGSGTVVSDGGGGGTTTWANGGTIACRVDPLGGAGGRVTGGQIDERSTHQVTVPPGVVVSPSNRFTVVGGGTFEVTATHTRTDAETQVFEVIQIF